LLAVVEQVEIQFTLVVVAVVVPAQW